jgi:hypothetical protein
MKNGGDIFILDPLFSRRQKNEYFGGHNLKGHFIMKYGNNPVLNS